MVFALLGSYGIFARLRSEGIQMIGHWYTPRAENDGGFFCRDPVKARSKRQGRQPMGAVGFSFDAEPRFCEHVVKTLTWNPGPR